MDRKGFKDYETIYSMPNKSMKSQPLAIQKLFYISDAEEFTTEGGIKKLKSMGFRYVPSNKGLGAMLKASPYFEKSGQTVVEKKYIKNGAEFSFSSNENYVWKKI